MFIIFFWIELAPYIDWPVYKYTLLHALMQTKCTYKYKFIKQLVPHKAFICQLQRSYQPWSQMWLLYYALYVHVRYKEWENSGINEGCSTRNAVLRKPINQHKIYGHNSKKNSWLHKYARTNWTSFYEQWGFYWKPLFKFNYNSLQIC